MFYFKMSNLYVQAKLNAERLNEKLATLEDWVNKMIENHLWVDLSYEIEKVNNILFMITFLQSQKCISKCTNKMFLFSYK